MAFLIVQYNLPTTLYIAEKYALPERSKYMDEEYWKYVRQQTDRLLLKHSEETKREITIYYTTQSNAGKV